MKLSGAFIGLVLGTIIIGLAGCGGGGVTKPIAASGAGGLPPVAGAPPPGAGSPVVVGAQASPYPLATPAGATGALTGVQLESLLSAAQTPAPGTGGALGIVTTVSANGFVLEQPIALATPAGDTSNADVHNYAPFGTPGSDIAITTNATTFYETGTTGAAIQPGALVAVTGTPAGSGLTATYVALLTANDTAAQSTVRAAKAISNAAAAGASALTAATTAQAASVRRPLGEVTQPGTFATYIGTPPVAYDNPIYTLPLGCAALYVHTQAAFDLALQYAFPYELIYNPNPPQYQASGSGYTGPGDYDDWLTLSSLPPPSGQNTASIGVGFAFGVKLTLKTCANTLFAGKELTLTSATFGYDVRSTTNAAMPYDGQQEILTPSNCAGVTQPFNISFITNPKTGFPDLNPFNGTSSFQLSLCDPAVLTGANVTGSIANLTGGSGGAGSFIINPSSGLPLFGPTLLQPQSNRMQFQLANLAYPLTMQDKLAVQLQLADQPVFQTPATGGIFASNTYNAVPTSPPQPVSIGAPGSNVPLCITLGTGDPIGATTACTGSSTGVITSYICNNPPSPAFCTSDTTSVVTLQLTEANYTGPITGTDTTLPVGITASYNELCGDGQTYANPISFTGGGNGPTANFTISAGGGVTSALEDCYIVFYDSNNSSVAIDLKMI